MCSLLTELAGFRQRPGETCPNSNVAHRIGAGRAYLAFVSSRYLSRVRCDYRYSRVSRTGGVSRDGYSRHLVAVGRR